jgi:hypothetical protein
MRRKRKFFQQYTHSHYNRTISAVHIYSSPAGINALIAQINTYLFAPLEQY